MALQTDVAINIGSEFTGKKAFKQAESSTTKLQNGVKNLAKSFGIAFSVGSVVAFGKAAAKAFIQDEAAAAKLNKTIYNLGLGFEDTRVKTFISDLEALSGVADTQLRPAFEKLLTTTGSVNKSQELLKTALDVAAGSGVDLVTVASDLSKAFLGNTKGLTKYNIGLTQAELKTASFEEIQAKLNAQFSGQNQARLDTYAGKIDLLKVSFDNMQETIGKSLVDSFALLAGDNGISGATQAMENFGTQIADVITGISTLTSALNTLPGAANVSLFDVGNIPVIGAYLKILQGMGEAQRLAPKPFSTPMTISGSTDAQAKIDAARKKAEAEAAKRAKELLALSKKQAAAEKEKAKQKQIQLALDKAALALGKGEDVFDLDKIQNQAAILANQEAIAKLGDNATQQQKAQLANDAQRLLVKQLMLELDDAIAAKDADRATALAKQLNAELLILGSLQNQTYKLTDINNLLDKFKPKDLINLENLDAALRKLIEMSQIQFNLSPIIPSQDYGSITTLNSDIFTFAAAGNPDAIAALNAHSDAISILAESELALADALLAESENALSLIESTYNSALPAFIGFDPARFRMADNITVNVNAGVIGNDDMVEDAVQRAFLAIERKGLPLRYNGGL